MTSAALCIQIEIHRSGVEPDSYLVQTATIDHDTAVIAAFNHVVKSLDQKTLDEINLVTYKVSVVNILDMTKVYRNDYKAKIIGESNVIEFEIPRKTAELTWNGRPYIVDEEDFMEFLRNGRTSITPQSVNIEVK